MRSRRSRRAVLTRGSVPVLMWISRRRALSRWRLPVAHHWRSCKLNDEINKKINIFKRNGIKFSTSDGRAVRRRHSTSYVRWRSHLGSSRSHGRSTRSHHHPRSTLMWMSLRSGRALHLPHSRMRRALHWRSLHLGPLITLLWRIRSCFGLRLKLQ